jgi:hypothetical protein
MLKDMAVPGEEGQDETGEESNGQMSYDKKLSTGCSRHTAAGVFFELLQLKTWDYTTSLRRELWGHQR